MSDEKQKSKPDDAAQLLDGEEQGAESAPPKSFLKGPIGFALIALVVFAVAVGAFSYMMGVFSTAPPPDEQAKTADSLSTMGQQPAPVEDTSEIDALEQKIFGAGDITTARDLDDVAKLADMAPAVAASDSSSPPPALDERAQMAKERAELDERKKQLDQQQYQLEQLLARSSQMESSRITALAKLYDGMKPAQVAPLIAKLTDDQAVLVLLKMKPANAARILGELTPELGARISARMITLTEEK